MADKNINNQYDYYKEIRIDGNGALVTSTSSGEVAFSTTTPLASSATYSSGILDMTNSSQIQTEITASHDGSMTFTFYSDAGGTDAVRSIVVPYIAANGFQLYSAPTFGFYVKYEFTNTSASLQTDFYFATKFLPTALSAQVLARNGFLASAMTSTIIRNGSEFNSDRNKGLIGGESSKRKFGVNQSVGNSPETVWSYSSNWIPNQVKNEKLRIKAGGDANDDAAGSGCQSVLVTFLDDNLLEVEETIVTAGALASLDTTANCFRLLSAKVVNVGTYHGSNAGSIIFELTGGNIMGNIAADKGTTEQCILTVPSGKTAYITEILISVGSADSCDVVMYSSDNSDDVSTPFSAKIEQWALADFTGAEIFKLDTHLKFDEGSDIWVEAEKITGAGNARVSVDLNYYLVNN